jgi:hypothetical protein
MGNQLLVYADGVNQLGDNVDTVKEKRDFYRWLD